MENKKTAVEWLEEKINSESIIPFAKERFKWLAQARQMEEIQIKDAYDTAINHQLDRYSSTNSEKYFQETYGKEPKEFWIAISKCPKKGRIVTTAIEEIVGESYMKEFVDEFNKTGIAEAGGLPIIKIIKTEI
jgi:lysyl-tRNA synthetase class I